MTSRARRAVAGATVAGVLALAGTASCARESDGSFGRGADGDADARSSTGDLGGSDDDASGATGPDPSAPPTVGGWPVVTSADGAYSIALPRGWTLATLDDAPTAVAARLVHGLPFEAEVAELITEVERWPAHSVAVDAASWTPGGAAEVVVIERFPDGVRAAAVVDTYRFDRPGVVVGDELVTDGARDITRLDVVMPDTLGRWYDVDVYVIRDGTRTWAVSMWTDWTMAQGISERIALSFTPLAAVS